MNKVQCLRHVMTILTAQKLTWDYVFAFCIYIVMKDRNIKKHTCKKISGDNRNIFHSSIICYIGTSANF